MAHGILSRGPLREALNGRARWFACSSPIGLRTRVLPPDRLPGRPPSGLMIRCHPHRCASAPESHRIPCPWALDDADKASPPTGHCPYIGARWRRCRCKAPTYSITFRSFRRSALLEMPRHRTSPALHQPRPDAREPRPAGPPKSVLGCPRKRTRESGATPELTRSGNGVVARYATGRDRPGRFWGRESRSPKTCRLRLVSPGLAKRPWPRTGSSCPHPVFPENPTSTSPR